MKPAKKLAMYIIGVNAFGLLVSSAIGLTIGILEGILMFPIATIAASSLVYWKHKDEYEGDSDDSEVNSLIIPKN